MEKYTHDTGPHGHRYGEATKEAVIPEVEMFGSVRTMIRLGKKNAGNALVRHPGRRRGGAGSGWAGGRAGEYVAAAGGGIEWVEGRN